MGKVPSGEVGFILCNLLGATLRVEYGLLIVKYTPRIIVAQNGSKDVLEIYQN